MLLFVGLGNPTPNSEDNRHNVGFKIIDAINQKFSLSKQKPKFKGLLTTGLSILKLMHMTSVFFMMILILILGRLKQNLVGLTQDIMELRLLINL